jgi:hypothetical protein
LDGVLAIGQMPTDVRGMDCDFYAAGFPKLCNGPRATGLFFAKPDLVEQLSPLFGAMDEEAQRNVPLWNSKGMAKFKTFGAHLSAPKSWGLVSETSPVAVRALPKICETAFFSSMDMLLLLH